MRKVFFFFLDRESESRITSFLTLLFSLSTPPPPLSLERKMGQAMGQDCGLLEEVCSWVAAKTELPFWAKLTPNVTSIADAGRAALAGGARGLAAINTINSISGVDLDTLRPQPCVEGATTPGGYSGPAVKPVALAKVAALAGMIQGEKEGKFDLSGIGGVETGADAAEFLLLGADNVQVYGRFFFVVVVERKRARRREQREEEKRVERKRKKLTSTSREKKKNPKKIRKKIRKKNLTAAPASWSTATASPPTSRRASRPSWSRKTFRRSPSSAGWRCLT